MRVFQIKRKKKQSVGLQDNPMIHMLHRDFPHIGGWTVIPLIDQLNNLHQNNSTWIFFLQDNTNVVLDKLMNTFDKYNENDVSIYYLFFFLIFFSH